jgi:hypothetical protein
MEGETMAEEKFRILVNDDEVAVRSALPNAGRHFINMAVKGVEVNINEIERDFVKIIKAVVRLYESASSITKEQLISSISFNVGFGVKGEVGLLSLLKANANTNGGLTVTLTPQKKTNAPLSEKGST